MNNRCVNNYKRCYSAAKLLANKKKKDFNVPLGDIKSLAFQAKGR
jgi:hypothetical protein